MYVIYIVNLLQAQGNGSSHGKLCLPEDIAHLFSQFEAEIFFVARLGKASIPEAPPCATSLGFKPSKTTLLPLRTRTVIFNRTITNNTSEVVASLAVVMMYIMFALQVWVGAFRIHCSSTFLSSHITIPLCLIAREASQEPHLVNNKQMFCFTSMLKNQHYSHFPPHLPVCHHKT